MHFLTTGVDSDDPSWSNYEHRVFYIGTVERALLKSGRVQYTPLSLADVPRLFDSGQLALDVAMVEVAPRIPMEPAAWGYRSTSPRPLRSLRGR